MDADTTTRLVTALWDDSIVPELTEYIRIPNQSPAYDPEWQAHGFMDQAVERARKWVEARGLAGSKLEVLRLPGRTPLLMLEIDGQRPGTVLMYGHLDKQPPFSGWHEGLGPWTPVYRDGKLYGRGGADDGYAVFASVAAVEALRAQGVPLPRIVVAIECSEESGSPDLPAYVDAYADRIGSPNLVVCLDSGAGDYERLWVTTSLRGLVAGDLRVDVLKSGVHSGDASGIVPSSFRILRQLVSRLEDQVTGKVLLPELHVEVPAERLAQARHAARVLGDTVWTKFGLIDGTRPMGDDETELILNRTWRPTLSVTGAAGLPPLAQAGSVLRPSTTLRLSVRIPPHVDPERATAALTKLLTDDPPYGAKVTFTADGGASGWEAPPTAPWLEQAMAEASQTYFGKAYAALGEGGTIPFMGMLSAKFPAAQFIVTGVLGPESNAHGPNEFLHVPFARRLTCCVADVIARMP
ncbi:MAG: M20 family metallopeptidase [Myxococcota bacterium]